MDIFIYQDAMFHHSANESQNARHIERTIESEQVQIYSKIAMQSK